MEKTYLDIINNQDLWTSIQLAESFAVETSLGDTELDLSGLGVKDGFVVGEIEKYEVTQELIENTEFSYWDSNGEERVIKINPCLETSRNIYQLLFERVLKAEDYITIASSIKEKLKDEDWALSICKIAQSRCFTIWDYDKTIKLFIDLLFPSVFCQETKKYRRFQNINEDHKDLLEIILSEAKDIAVQTIDFLRVAELIISYELEEIFPDTLDPILEKASNKSRSVSDMLDIAYFYLTWIKEGRQDARKKADVYFKKAEDLCVDSEDYKAIAEKLFEALDGVDEELEEYINIKYRDWMRELLNKAAKTSFLSYERDNLIYFSQDEYGFNDPELTRALKKEFSNHPILVHKNNLSQSTIDKITQMDSRYEVLTLSDELCENNQKDEARELLRLCELCSYRPSDLISLGDNISKEDYISDKEWATDVYKKAIKHSHCTTDLSPLAYKIAVDSFVNLNDKKWAKEIFVKALDLCVTFDDYSRLSNDIHLALEDSTWAIEVLGIGEKYARTSFDFKELGAHYSGGYNMDPVDMKKAKDFFNIAVEKIQENIDLYEITRHVSQDLKDEKWAKELCEMQLESNKGFHSLDSYALVNLANLVNVNLNDKDFAKQIFTKALEISNNDNDAVDYILGEVENEWGYNDKDLAAAFRTKYKK